MDKQMIEEMAKVVRKYYSGFSEYKVAEEIYRILIPEGAVVLTREEYEKDLAKERELGELKAKRARKETAEKFAERLKALVADRNCNEDYEWEDVQVDGQIFIECVDEICKEITEEM